MLFDINPIFKRNLIITAFLSVFMIITSIAFTTSINAQGNGFRVDTSISSDYSRERKLTQEEIIDREIDEFMGNTLNLFNEVTNRIIKILMFVLVIFCLSCVSEAKNSKTGIFINSIPINRTRYLSNIMFCCLIVIIITCIFTFVFSVINMRTTMQKIEDIHTNIYPFIGNNVLVTIISEKFLFATMVISFFLLAQILMSNPIIGIIFAILAVFVPEVWFSGINRLFFYNFIENPLAERQIASINNFYSNYISNKFHYRTYKYTEAYRFGQVRILTKVIGYTKENFMDKIKLFSKISIFLAFVFNGLSLYCFNKMEFSSNKFFQFKLVRNIFVVLFPITVGFAFVTFSRRRYFEVGNSVTICIIIFLLGFIISLTAVLKIFKKNQI